MTNNNYYHSYWKSTLSGMVYEMPADFVPSFGGWEAVSRETYVEYAKSKGLL